LAGPPHSRRIHVFWAIPGRNSRHSSNARDWRRPGEQVRSVNAATAQRYFTQRNGQGNGCIVAIDHASALAQTAGVRYRFRAEAALAAWDLLEASQAADEAVATATGGTYLSHALTTRARVAIAQGESDEAERDAHDALTRAAEVHAHLHIPDALECLGTLAGDAGSHREAARLFGAADAIRRRMGAVRFKVYDADYEASVTALREAMGDNDFESAWAEGAALSTEEAIAYA
jgi:hypothetical protein